jgi:hypothetical protein
VVTHAASTAITTAVAVAPANLTNTHDLLMENLKAQKALGKKVNRGFSDSHTRCGGCSLDQHPACGLVADWYLRLLLLDALFYSQDQGDGWEDVWGEVLFSVVNWDEYFL